MLETGSTTTAESPGFRGHGMAVGALGVLLATVTMAMALDSGLAAVTACVGIAGGVFLSAAGLLTYLGWRASPEPGIGWLAAALLVVGIQELVGSGYRLAPDSLLEAERQGLGALAGTAAASTALALARMAAGRRTVSPDPLVVGGALGFVLVLAHLFAPAAPSLLGSSVTVALVALTVAAYVGLAATLAVNDVVSRWVSRRLALGLVLLCAAPVARVVASDSVRVSLAADAGVAVAGVLWLCATWGLLHACLERQRVHASRLEGALLELEAATRTTQEKLHEVRATLAGLAHTSELLGGDGVPPEVRDRMERGVRRELGRLARLVCGATEHPEVVDLDEALDAVVDLHRSRGHLVEHHRSGAKVVAQPDALAAAVNILLDNAATHGGDATSRIDVRTAGRDAVDIEVSDDGPNVPDDLRDRVFDWGVSRQGSPGQGIGLAMARRLVDGSGGSLTLAPSRESGTTFVIRLAVPRQPTARDRDEQRTR